ncbi:hypothetical protein [Paenibacillus humicus]|uniref:hypothetical protein n=1 Tax=Paenibacillus humicus TaxID=412861 RepID=UPI001FE2747A|nr:hypothetical protein [Paenibacillus humicus]
MRTFFFCYDRAMKVRLCERGFRYITVALHPRTHRIFWMFENNPELTAALHDLTREGGDRH